ncbi:MAG: hypothetical protein IJM18_10330 [Clostridia bacterium]|nr:hypothetical protein [Clostridia bacterium]
MKKHKCCVTLILVLVFSLAGAAAVYASVTAANEKKAESDKMVAEPGKVLVPPDQAEEFVAKLDAEAYERAEHKYVEPPYEPGVYERFEASATPEQKAEIKAYAQSSNLGTWIWCTRKQLELMGEIPEDTPRITLEQAKKICAGFDPSEYKSVSELEYDLTRAFNTYTVPDFDGGSGISIVTYLLDADGNRYIKISMGTVTYYDRVNNTSEELLSILD